VQSLLSLDYPSDKIEIIVVDDASEDATPDAVAGLPVRLIVQSRQAGPAACRNVGTAAARGEIIAYTDSDCVVDRDWLLTLLSYFGDKQIGIVGGLVEPFDDRSAIDRYEAVNSSLYLGREEGDVRPNSSIPFLPTANLLVRHSIWQQLGGFDEAFPIGEDVDLVWRARDLGYQVRYVPRGRVRHKYRTSLRSYAVRRAFYGGSEALLVRKHRDKPKTLVISIAKLTFLGMLVASVLSGWYPLAAASLIVPAFDFVGRAVRLRRFGAPVHYRWVLGAQCRDYAAYYYHLCGNFARYYSLPALAVGLLWPPLFIGALLALLYPAAYDFVSRRPRLNWHKYLALYWLELFAHQLGLFRRCFQCGAFGVLVPRLIFYLGLGAS
jgi:mycofactocin system glycosyltransferase